MSTKAKNNIDNLIVVGDRLLINPKTLSNKIKSRLVPLPGYKEKEEIQTGYITKYGSDYPIPLASEDQEGPWKRSDEKVKYIPIQARKGDSEIFIQKGSIEIVYNDQNISLFLHSILLLARDDDLFT